MKPTTAQNSRLSILGACLLFEAAVGACTPPRSAPSPEVLQKLNAGALSPQVVIGNSLAAAIRRSDAKAVAAILNAHPELASEQLELARASGSPEVQELLLKAAGKVPSTAAH